MVPENQIPGLASQSEHLHSKYPSQKRQYAGIASRPP